MYGVKKDANHGQIVDAFKKLGAGVVDMSRLGCGVPDLVVWCRGQWLLVDVKNPKTRYGQKGLNKRQKEWATDWKGGPVFLISTVEQVGQMVNGEFGALKRFPEGGPLPSRLEYGPPEIHVIESVDDALRIIRGTR